MFAVAVEGNGADLILAYTDAKAIHLVIDGKERSAAFDSDGEPWDKSHLIGHAYSIAILSDDTVIVSDLNDNAIRFVRFDAPPFVVTHMSRTLVGGRHDATGSVGGYRDGAPDRALANEPLGVAVAPDGSIYFADAGNRRIRKISGVVARGPVHPDLKGLVGPKNSYRIVLVGNSYMFKLNILWPESIPGQIESGLAIDARRVHLEKRPFVSLAELDGAGVTEMAEFIDAYLSNGEADVVCLFINGLNHRNEVSRPGFENDRWKVEVPKELQNLQKTLRASGTQLLLVYTPQGIAISTTEETETLLDAYGDGGGWNDTMKGWSSQDEPIEAFYSGLNIRMLALSRAMRATEGSRNHPPFFATDDVHFSADGATWVGRAVLRGLEEWHPWSTR